ncbi:HNH endonuclease signature motif containing protein [Nocardioides sp.]|uniref:HNH endonuclease signature motif containing protein n=1 Tax=Nocardioides sp. TaxID=35761 RepID=UPI00351253F0
MVGLAGLVAEQRARARAAEVGLLELATVWAYAHPDVDAITGEVREPASVADDVLAAYFVGVEPEEHCDSPSWAGLPRLDETATAGFACAADLSEPVATRLIRDALILAHRLPRCWRRVLSGEVDVWRARRVAAAVAGAPDDVCTHIDLEVAPRLAVIGPISLDDLIRAAMIRLHPDAVEAASLERLEQAYVTLEHRTISHTGLVQLSARGEYAEFDDLDHTLDTLADLLPTLTDTLHPVHPDDPRDYRRARALGLLADPAAAAALLATGHTPDHEPAEEPVGEPDQETGEEPGAARRQVDLVVHVTPETLAGTDPVAGIATSPGAAVRHLFADAVAAWCGRPRTDITVRPVLDLGARITHHTYRPGATLTRQIRLRDRTCRFPHCARPAERCDLDHLTPHARGGPTDSDNLLALCRHHHRLKTHHGYHPDHLAPGITLWHTPVGALYLVTPDGTRRLTMQGDSHPDAAL